MYYAKSKPDVLSVIEHTRDVQQAVEVLYQTYGKHLPLFTEEDWHLLRTAALYHDVGKYSEGFQSAIKSVVESSKAKKIENYPHNYLSVAMTPFKELRKKYQKEKIQNLALSIGFHHERNIMPLKERIIQIFHEQILPQQDAIKNDFGEELDFTMRLNEIYLGILEQRQRLWSLDEQRKHYILLKGLLHRADYAASAKRKEEDVAVYTEQGIFEDVGHATNQYFTKKGYLSKRPLQQFAFDNQDKNIVLVAQTGSGKTEASLFWIGDRKGFITLPLRVSINAMHKRIHHQEEIGFESTGLLHSGAMDYLISSKEDEDATFGIHEQSIKKATLLSYKVTLSTIDQIFKFPLLYKGFERELATLSYSKVVIDEIQAYDPHIVAVLIKGIEMITELGGQWMIMTATLPTIFKDSLYQRGLLKEHSIQKTVLLSDDLSAHCEMPRRHRIQIVEGTILNAVAQILELGENGKVLVVVNTIGQALRMYDLLHDEGGDVNLLHSQFVIRDRQQKEAVIKDFAQLDNRDSGIWVTTQIVEASLDVDFDFLFTEAATPDSLFQRFGRCNRKGERYPKTLIPLEPNVFIFAEEASGIGYIYEQSIVNHGLRLLTQCNGQVLSEQQKLEIVEDTFSRESLAGTKYLKMFDQALEELDNMTPFDKEGKEAQRILRNITSVQIIPGDKLYQKAIELKEQYYSTPVKNVVMRKKIALQLEQLTLSVNPYTLKHRSKEHGFVVSSFDEKYAFRHICYADVKYDEERGLELVCDSIESRFW